MSIKDNEKGKCTYLPENLVICVSLKEKKSIFCGK